MKNIPEKSSILEKFHTHLDEAYHSLNVGESTKKIRKLLHRSSKKISGEVYNLLVEDFKKREKELRKAAKKEQKKNKKLLKKQKEAHIEGKKKNASTKGKTKKTSQPAR